MPKPALDGIFVPHITPFTSEGELDLKALRVCVKFWLENDAYGLVSCGSNGEAPYLNRQERIKVIQTVVDEVNGKIPVIAGTGSISTKETIEFTKDAKDLGADAALIVTPFYFKPANREVQEHYRTISESVDLPIVVYNVPKFTGFSIEATFIHQLVSENEKIIGLKDSSGNIGAITETIRLVGDMISVLAGTADIALPTLLLGGRGAVLAVANVFPKFCSQLYESCKSGKYEEAKMLQKRIAFVNEILVKRYNQLSAIKEALTLKGLPAGYPRKPALPLENEERNVIQNLLEHIDEKWK